VKHTNIIIINIIILVVIEGTDSTLKMSLFFKCYVIFKIIIACSGIDWTLHTWKDGFTLQQKAVLPIVFK
jgi:hypothetical protein